MIEFVNGDMFATSADIRVNTVNCVGVMGAGMALAFKRRYPAMFKEYERACRAGEVRPGRLHDWRSLDGDWVINFPTKRDWREPSRYEDIDAGLDALRDYLAPLGDVTLALPALGCGHGGLDWSRVSKMIERKLGDVAAHVLVFAPDDSKRAGKDIQVPTQEEREAARALGYARADERGAEAPYSTSDVSPEVGQWIALFTSRQPSGREEAALRSVAVELARRRPNARIALVHSGRPSEEIAQLLADAGLNAVLIAPFGVLTRRSLAKVARDSKRGSVNILSWAPPSTKWSKLLFAEAIGHLRSNANAVLLSDPNPDWLLRRDQAWRNLPISYLRYDEMSDMMREELSRLGALPLGRRSDNGAPKLDALFSIFEEQGGFSKVRSPVPPSVDSLPRDATTPFTIDLTDVPDELWESIGTLVRQANPSRVLLTGQFGAPTEVDALMRKLERLLRGETGDNRPSRNPPN